MAPYFSVSASELSPGYSVSNVNVAKKLVNPGRLGPMTVWFCSSTHPKKYSGGTSSSYWPSIAASLVGCCSQTPTAVEVRRDEQGARGDQRNCKPGLHRLLRKIEVRALQVMVRGDGNGDQAANYQGCRYGMEVTQPGGGVERRSQKVSEHRVRPIGGQLGASRRLHPGIGDEDPQRRQARPEPHQPGGHAVEQAADLFAAEQQARPGTPIPGRTRTAPRPPAARRRCRPRTASSRPSWCRTRTPS